MKVKELIELLQEVENKEREVRCLESRNTKSEYGEIFEVSKSDLAKYVRIYFSS